MILDVKTEHMKIVHKLKNHEDSINCLFWCPIEKESSQAKSLQGLWNVDDSSMLFCSSAEDKTVRVWCAEKGTQLRCFKAPGAQTQTSRGKQQQQQDKQISKISYTPLLWSEPRFLLSGSYKYFLKD